MQDKNDTKSTKSTKKLAATPKSVSPQQLTIPGFETPFEQKLAKLIP